MKRAKRHPSFTRNELFAIWDSISADTDNLAEQLDELEPAELRAYHAKINAVDKIARYFDNDPNAIPEFVS